MAVVQQQGVYVSSEEAKAALLSGTNIEVEETGKTVDIGSTIYARTNFWIKQSREYVQDHKLTRYFYLFLMHWTFPIPFIVSLFTPFDPIFAAVMAVIGGIYLLIFIQHMYVNVKTMPHVLKQPCVPNHWLQRQNTFLEIKIESYRAFFAASSEARIGCVIQGTGKVKIQVFQQAAFTTMKKCIALSTFYLLLSSFMVCYCLAWMIIKSIEKAM